MKPLPTVTMAIVGGEIMEKCKCGQPYRTQSQTYFPDKDVFSATCPSCGRNLEVKAHSIDVEWVFDKEWKGQE